MAISMPLRMINNNDVPPNNKLTFKLDGHEEQVGDQRSKWESTCLNAEEKHWWAPELSEG